MLATLSPIPRHDLEQWKPIPNWPYEASDLGRVRRIPWLDMAGCLHLGGEVAQWLHKRDGNGYQYVTMRDGRRRRNAAVHVLVLEAWVGLKPTPKHEGCHGNGICTDNSRANLRWDTKKANRADRVRHEQEKAVTTLVTTDAETGLSRHGAKVSGGGGIQGQSRHGPFQGDGLPHTGSLPIPFTFPSLFPSLKPVPSPVSVFRSLRSRQAA